MLLRLSLVAFGLGLYGSAHGTETGEVMPPPEKEARQLRGLYDIWLNVTGMYVWSEPHRVGPEQGGAFLAEMLFGGTESFDPPGDLEVNVKNMLEKQTALRVTIATANRMPPPEAVLLSVAITLKGKPGIKDPPTDVALDLFEQAQLVRNPAVRIGVASYAGLSTSAAAGVFLTLEQPVREVVEIFIKDWREQNE